MRTPEVVLQLRTDPGEVGTIRADIRSPEWTRDAWFSSEGTPLRGDATPFVPAALLIAMSFRARLVVDGEVSTPLLENVPAIQRLFCLMRPRWRPVEVHADHAAPGDRAAGVGTFLSLGLDSMSTAVRRRDELTHLVMLRHFGAELPPAVARLERGVRELADRDGKTPIFLDSNVRQLGRRVANWTRFHGAGLAGSAHALAPVVGTVMIASSMWRQEMVAYSSTPFLDPLWSSGETTVIHEGAEFSRTEKTIAIAHDDLALRYLHPCFLATGESYNCGRCGKCLRTMANLRIAGVVDAPAFDRPLDLALLAAQSGTLPVMEAPYRELLWGALTFAPQDTELIDALAEAMTPPASRIKRWRLLLGKRRAF